MREELETALRDFEGEDIALLEPRDFYDQFIVGLGQQGHRHFIVYDKDALIAGLVKQTMEDHDEEDLINAELAAIDHFEYNIVGSWVGDGTPAFLTKYEGDNGSTGDAARAGDVSQHGPDAG